MVLFLTSESNSRRWQRRGSPYDPIDKLTISFFCMQYLLKADLRNRLIGRIQRRQQFYQVSTVNVESKPRFAVRYEK